MPPIVPTPTLTDFLRLLPKKVIGGVVAGAGFAVIGVFNTFQFFVNHTADLIAYAADARREEEWAPVILATFLVTYLTYYLLLRFLAEQPQQQKNNNNLAPQQEPSAPFHASSDFAAALRNAGQAGTLFGLPKTKQRAPTPAQPLTSIKKSASDAILDAAIAEVNTQQPVPVVRS